MDQTGLRLPIRLVPRKGSQLLMVLFFIVFLGFAVYWTAKAAGLTGELDWTYSEGPEWWLSWLFPALGGWFILFGLAGLARAVLKLLPDSPYYHLEIGAEGLLVRQLFKRRLFAWRELPKFETLEHKRRTKHGIKLEHYTVAAEHIAPAANGPAAAARRRELVRIFADEYGAKNGKLDADALTDWLNRLYALAAQGRLAADSPVEVPEGFRASVRQAAADARGQARVIGAAPVGRSAPVIEQADKRPDRPQTVVRR